MGLVWVHLLINNYWDIKEVRITIRTVGSKIRSTASFRQEVIICYVTGVMSRYSAA